MAILEPTYLIQVFLVFIRIGSLLATAPFFGHKSIPIRIRIFLAVFLSYLLVGFVPAGLPWYATTTTGLMVCVILEVMTGAMLGFSVQFIFWSFQFFAEVLGFQMGLAMAQIFNPLDATSTNPLGQVMNLMLLIVFLIIDGHHLVLQGLVYSFEPLPLAGARLETAGPMFLQWASALFLAAMQLASPFLVTFFLIETALGVFARIVPQADMFSLGLPLKLLVGLGVLIVYVGNLFPLMPDIVQGAVEGMLQLIDLMTPG